MSTMAFTEMYLAAVRWRDARDQYQIACQRVVNGRRTGHQNQDDIAVLAAATDERINAEEQLVRAVAALDETSRANDQSELEIELEDLRDATGEQS